MNWSELVLTANEIITEFGQTITVNVITQGTYDPDTSMIINTTTTTSTKGVMFDYGEKDVNGTTILKGDKKILVTPVGNSNISVNDTVTVQGVTYQIISMTQTNPAGTNLLWELSVRGIS